MKAFFLAIATALVLFSAGSGFIAQSTSSTAAPQGSDPSITPNGAIGEVKAIDAATKQLVVKTDGGSLVTVVVSDTTQYHRVAPGETTLKNATQITFADLSEGDRVFGRGTTSEDRKSVAARVVVVMSKADIAKKQEAERAEWRRRGVAGVITALKPETKEITLSTRSMAGQQAVVVPVADTVELRRYAPDSIKFADAKPSKFEELKVGDQIRALGDRTPDGASMKPEKIVTGAFRVVGGTVTAVDAASGEVKINDLQTKQPLTIVIKQDAVLRKFPAMGEGGGMTVMRPGGAPGGPGGQAPAQGGTGPGGQGAGPRPGGGMNIQDMLERLPTIAISDLKVGDTILVSSTKGADPTRLTAITLVSGADTLLTMVAARQQQPGQAAPNPAAGLGSGIQFGIGLP